MKKRRVYGNEEKVKIKDFTRERKRKRHVNKGKQRNRRKDGVKGGERKKKNM